MMSIPNTEPLPKLNELVNEEDLKQVSIKDMFILYISIQ
jgi:hypothetical protein